jgi:FlaA1/EpsC-like NDP-sugar epimerase
LLGLALPAGTRNAIAVGFDLSAVALAWAASFWLRYNLEIPMETIGSAATALPWVMMIHVAAFLAFRLYSGIWRYASLPDLRRILLAVGIAALAVPTVLFLLQRGEGLPRSVFILHPILLLFIMCGGRAAYRTWKEHRLYSPLRDKGKALIVLGAGEMAVQLIRDLARSEEWQVVAILDDDLAKKGASLHGVRIEGSWSSLPEIAASLGASHAALAVRAPSSQIRRRAYSLCGEAKVDLLTVPALSDYLGGQIGGGNLRRVQLEDLLGRNAIELDSPGLTKMLERACVVVTGAGGSIGAEIVRQVASFNPARLVLVDASEFSLFNIEREMVLARTGITVEAVVADIRDAQRIARVLASCKPDVIFHAAAYKHVPLMEDTNAWECLRNNIIGTHNVARAAIASGAKEFVLISTDKAVNPTNVMGASKRAAELLMQSLDFGATRAVAVRFGNVLGSSGSVVPIFREQIAAGGPVTVTHPDMRRYFMLIPEAVQLVLQAGLMANTGQNNGSVMVLDMGEPVKIADLARDMIRLSGPQAAHVKVEYTGLRPGEKLFEELLADNETTAATPHPKLRVLKAQPLVDGAWRESLLAWLAGDPPTEPAQVRARLAQFVPEYTPSSQVDANVTPPAKP